MHSHVHCVVRTAGEPRSRLLTYASLFLHKRVHRLSIIIEYNGNIDTFVLRREYMRTFECMRIDVCEFSPRLLCQTYIVIVQAHNILIYRVLMDSRDTLTFMRKMSIALICRGPSPVSEFHPLQTPSASACIPRLFHVHEPVNGLTEELSLTRHSVNLRALVAFDCNIPPRKAHAATTPRGHAFMALLLAVTNALTGPHNVLDILPNMFPVQPPRHYV